jgi:predicted PilT family ATPase
MPYTPQPGTTPERLAGNTAATTVILPTAVANYLATAATTDSSAPHAALATLRRLEGVEGRTTHNSTIEISLKDRDWFRDEIGQLEWLFRTHSCLRPQQLLHRQVIESLIALLGAWLRLDEAPAASA